MGPLTSQQLSGLYVRLDDSKVVRILTSTSDSFVTFSYRDKETYISFDLASPGQQASALLNLLLNQEAGTLIIDQPEDDLDNRVIMEIVRLLQRTKHKRQLVFATHNPNFVVNGDADKVISLAPSGKTDDADERASGPRIAISADGAIETNAVRSAITETMEGGRAAFELRSRKYLFTKD